MSTGRLLHPETFQGAFGERQFDALSNEVARFASTVTGATGTPDISVVIQSYDDTPEQLHRLFDDIEAQQYAGGIQPILVSAGNRKETLEAAQNRGAILSRVSPAPGLRADVLNRGLEVADNKYVFTTVGHAALSSNKVLRAAAHQIVRENVGGAFGIVLPDKGASLSERFGSRVLGATTMLESPQPVRMKKGGMGMLAADCSIVDRDIARTIGYDPAFGAGGADGKLGEAMLASGLLVVRDTVMAVHHTHGFSPAQSFRQLLAWRGMSRAQKYDKAKWAWHPNGGF